MHGRNLIDCVAVVSRYFGGTLLGTGGLIRAYSDAVALAVDDARNQNGLVTRERRELFRLALAHSDAGRVEAELRQHGVSRGHRDGGYREGAGGLKQNSHTP